MTNPKFDVIISPKIEDSLGIYIQEGEFKGLLVSIRSISGAPLHTDFEVEWYAIIIPETVTQERLESEDFQNIFQNIIKEIINEVEVDSTRNDDIETFNT